MATAPKLLVALEHGIKRISFNRPERRNSVDHETTELLHQAIVESATDGSRVVILTGTGDSFCAGADLFAVEGADIADFDVTASLRRTTNPTIEAMRALPKPIIARVHGHAVGVGCNYALACDLVIASEAALFAQIFVRIGLMPDGGSTYFLPRLVGYHKAFELMATGDLVPARDALALGMINRVVAVEELDATVEAMATRLAKGPEIALAQIKAALNSPETADLAGALDFEAVHQDACFRSPYFAHAVAAFTSKQRAGG
jgi:2-(1,2-epoxy-1,2-dihydrophenyl)acetyl-CoA isomerase